MSLSSDSLYTSPLPTPTSGYLIPFEDILIVKFMKIGKTTTIIYEVHYGEGGNSKKTIEIKSPTMKDIYDHPSRFFREQVHDEIRRTLFLSWKDPAYDCNLRACSASALFVRCSMH